MSSSRLAPLTFLSLAFISSMSFTSCKPVDPGAESGETGGDGDGDTGDGDGDTGDGDPTGDGDGDDNGDGDGDTGDGDPTGDGDGDDDPTCVSELDILFVVDNSGSMGAAQARLATSIPSLVDPLDAAGVSWRIGVTTTDNGNPWCPAGSTTPEAGKLVLSSCKSRLEQFLFNNGEVDAQDIACNDVCPLDDIQIAPTPTDFDNTPAPRPWIEKVGDATNLADAIDPATALACILPMGINGCGFESPLESGYLSLRRAENVAEAEYGFMRPGAGLLVIIVSDETDCSYNKEYSDIFDQDGNKVFWSDPGLSFPTSAICWNAGVECTGDPSGYDGCEPVNKDVDGSSNVDDASAVLHPLSRYHGLLDGIEQQQRAMNPNAIVQVSLIGGVGLDGTITYADSLDQDYQTSFGIGPGCSGGGEMQAVPPVRERAVSTHSGGSLHSVCADEYGTALAAIVEPFIATCE